jgi:hypothetical protein
MPPADHSNRIATQERARGVRGVYTRRYALVQGVRAVAEQLKGISPGRNLLFTETDPENSAPRRRRWLLSCSSKILAADRQTAGSGTSPWRPPYRRTIRRGRVAAKSLER